MQPYRPLVSRGPGLWTRDGDWYDTTFRRRMTIMALSTGELIVHNAFMLAESDLAELRALGRVAAIVTPNAFHGDEAGWLADQFPDAKIFVPQAARAKLSKRYRVDGSLESDWPAEWRNDIDCLQLSGMRLLHESVFIHRVSRTLVVTDLLFNLRPEDFTNSIERTLMRWNRVGMGLAPSRLCNTFFTRDLKARTQSLEIILERDFDRIVMNHGAIIDTDGKRKLREVFTQD